MSIATRAAACTSCGKRLNRKQWYYRNGQYFCKRRCWVKESEKTATEAAEKAGAQAKKDKEAAAAKEAPSAKEAPAAS